MGYEKYLFNSPSHLSYIINGYCFPKEARIYNNIEEANGITWLESFLTAVMAQFPELAEECREAISKIHGGKMYELNVQFRVKRSEQLPRASQSCVFVLGARGSRSSGQPFGVPLSLPQAPSQL